MFRGSLDNRPVALAGNAVSGVGVSQPVPVEPGRTYEVRCDNKVFVRRGGGQCRLVDVAVFPQGEPLVFVAEDQVISLAAASGDAVAWVRERIDDGGAAGDGGGGCS